MRQAPPLATDTKTLGDAACPGSLSRGTAQPGPCRALLAEPQFLVCERGQILVSLSLACLEYLTRGWS